MVSLVVITSYIDNNKFLSIDLINYKVNQINYRFIVYFIHKYKV